MTPRHSPTAADTDLTELASLGEQLQRTADRLTASVADTGDGSSGLDDAERAAVRRAATAARNAGGDVLAVIQARRRATGTAVPHERESVPVIRRTLISAPVRETLMKFVLSELPSQKDIAAAFAEQGLPDPVPDDGRVYRIQKVKLLSRYFDAIDWTDPQHVTAILTLCTRTLTLLRNRHRQFDRGELSTDVAFRRLQHQLASDGWHLDDGLHITALSGPAPADEPAPPRYDDPATAFQAAIYDALAAAQSIRQLMGGTGTGTRNAPVDFDEMLSWQLLDAAQLLQAAPRYATLPTVTRDAFVQLTGSASTLFLLTHQHGNLTWKNLDQSTTWIAQVTLRAWSQAALELLEVARGHRSGHDTAEPLLQ